ncbi:hypothetical protein Bca4012_068085 [Brassica carinata]|uniref:Uncharacterized protein n=1 Tax=Brassica carinata TaxID=52824 RepID=A0A8X7VU55_BRACI|nr:hypothetical protein Bca52824_020302 [Brassica carinata]
MSNPEEHLWKRLRKAIDHIREVELIEIETKHHRTVSVEDNNSLVPKTSSTKESLLEDISLTGQFMDHHQKLSSETKF